MRFECSKARLATAVAIAFVPASLCAAQIGLVPGHQKNGGTAGNLSGMLDGVDYTGQGVGRGVERGVIPHAEFDDGGVEFLRAEAAARVGPGLPEAPELLFGWEPQRPANAPSARRVPGAMVYDSARRRTVLFGGYDGALNDETWEWDGGNWTQRTVSPRPSPRVTIAMAYDSARDVTVLFGGVTPTGLSNETWEWDNEIWALKSTTGPAPRQWHAMAYDRRRGVTVLFGGNLGGAPGGLATDETWEWDGTNWTLRGGSGPPARFGHALAYESFSQQVILFGGRDPATGLYDDTWALGSGGWTPVATGGQPSPRHAHSMVSNGSGVTLFGGILDSGRSDETWYWRTTSWWPHRSPPAPSPRGMHGMAYDSRRSQIVLIGGDDGSSILDDTWELRSGGCPCSCSFDLSTGNAVCDIFDFLAFQNLFAAGEPCACDLNTYTGSGVCDIFDFLDFQNGMVGACP